MFFKNLLSKVKKAFSKNPSLDERWAAPSDEECGWTPLRPPPSPVGLQCCLFCNTPLPGDGSECWCGHSIKDEYEAVFGGESPKKKSKYRSIDDPWE